MKTSQTDPNYTSTNPLVTTWNYDDFARQILETRPDGTSTTVGYNLCGTACVNANNKLTVTRTLLNVGGTTQSVQNSYLDWFDRALVTSSMMLNGAYDRNEVQYDNLGRVQKKSAPCTFISCVNYWTTNTYDALNRLTQSQRPISATNGTLQTTMIQYAGRTTTVTDAQGKNSIKVNLVTGSPARTQDDNGYYINFNYDAFGSLLSVKDSLSNTLNTMTYDYGLEAFQRSSGDTDLGPRANTYDALGELVAYSDAKGQKFSVIYDALSRATSRTEPDLTTTWNWGNSASSFNIGKLQSVTAASTAGTYSEVYAYDSKTRPSTEAITIPGDAVYTYTSTYNATTGLLDTLQYPVSTSGYQLKLQYTYQNGILQQVSDVTTGTHYWIANAMNPRGQFTQETLGNGVVVNRALDAVTGWVGSIQAGIGGGATLQNNSYLFDEMGNLKQRQDNNLGLTENVYPDNLYRLDHTVGDSNTQMTYDGMGRILTWAAYGKATVTNNFTTPQSGCTYYTNPQLHAVRSSTAASQPAQSFCYDANGNTTTISASGVNLGSVDWTSFNQPNYIASGTTSGYLYYDGNHQRYKQAANYAGVAETTIYVGGLLEKVSNSSGTTYRHYIPGGNNLILYNRSSTGTNLTYYITKDHLGSSAVITDQTGALVVKEMFGAWGYNENTAAQQATVASISRHEYTGQEQIDNSGILLTNMNGRIYSPVGSLFLSPDPYVQDSGNTQNFNRYSYVYNNPLTNIDPSGFFSLGDLLNPFSSSNPLNPFGSFGRKLAVFPFTSSLALLKFGQRQGDSLLRDETWLQPIAEVAACYFGGPYACAGASAYLTRLNGGTVQQAFIAGFFSFAAASTDLETGNWASDALVRGVWAGDVSYVQGGSFGRGFALGAGGSLALSTYQAVTGGATPDPAPGQDLDPNIPKGEPGSAFYDTVNGEVPQSYWDKNVFGYNSLGGGCYQSSLCSQILDKIPGLNAVALLHDNWMISISGSTFANFATMLPAAALTYSALASEYLVPLQNLRVH